MQKFSFKLSAGHELKLSAGRNEHDVSGKKFMLFVVRLENKVSCRTKGDEIASGGGYLPEGGLRIILILYIQRGVGNLT